jgi:t-SNARE complex subunit (syntaxin)
MNSIIEQLKPQLKSEENEEADEAELRLKKNLFDAMIKKYQHTIQRFQEEESKIKKIKETKLVRGAEIALGEELDEQRRKEVIENPQMVKQIYEDKLKQKAPVKLINAVRDLEERHQDIKRLEKSVLELHKMILQLNALVQYQGEMIDNIVTNISQAKDAIIKGEKELGAAKNKMNCTRKIKCIIMIVVIAALLIIIIPIIVKFVK